MMMFRAGIASSSLVKIRGKGADTMILTNESPGSRSRPIRDQHSQSRPIRDQYSESPGRRVSRAHCKSSGYESIGGESTGSQEPVPGRTGSGETTPDVQILNYDSDTVTRMDR